MSMIKISQYTEATGSSCSGKTTFFKNVQRYITGGYISECVFPSFIVRCVFLVLGFYYLLLRPVKFFWVIRHGIEIQLSMHNKISALRNAFEKFGCYFIFRHDAVLIDEGISHIPFVYQLTEEQLIDFLAVFEKELRDISIILLTAPQESELILRLLSRGHKKVTSLESAAKFARLNIKISEAYVAAMNEQEKMNARII
ncbi:hypothetical protein ACQ0P8_13520 [Halodesulfovibrio aestuarii]|uniref:Uncharacterized protein n=1 Tax=Halodesulfovibrio aestuarii TaxID=126333 RepID=A0A8G2CAC7_9BACT|nr:hypothetical protein [Halodesulfovibrio aestuarii]SHJ29169.1 hypothetical protein SAMN05660830_02096 [Halodesulfovibrio aestuarii]